MSGCHKKIVAGILKQFREIDQLETCVTTTKAKKGKPVGGFSFFIDLLFFSLSLSPFSVELFPSLSSLNKKCGYGMVLWLAHLAATLEDPRTDSCTDLDGFPLMHIYDDNQKVKYLTLYVPKSFQRKNNPGTLVFTHYTSARRKYAPMTWR